MSSFYANSILDIRNLTTERRRFVWHMLGDHRTFDDMAIGAWLDEYPTKENLKALLNKEISDKKLRNARIIYEHKTGADEWALD